MCSLGCYETGRRSDLQTPTRRRRSARHRLPLCYPELAAVLPIPGARDLPVSSPTTRCPEGCSLRAERAPTLVLRARLSVRSLPRARLLSPGEAGTAPSAQGRAHLPPLRNTSLPRGDTVLKGNGTTGSPGAPPLPQDSPTKPRWPTLLRVRFPFLAAVRTLFSKPIAALLSLPRTTNPVLWASCGSSGHAPEALRVVRTRGARRCVGPRSRTLLW